MSDLPDRILWIARESGYGVGDIVEDECGAMILHARYKGDAQYPHIAHNGPKATLRRCEADKRTVERHSRVGAREWVGIGHDAELRYRCEACWRPIPCPDLLDRAAAWDVEAS